MWFKIKYQIISIFQTHSFPPHSFPTLPPHTFPTLPPHSAFTFAPLSVTPAPAPGQFGAFSPAASSFGSAPAAQSSGVAFAAPSVSGSPLPTLAPFSPPTFAPFSPLPVFGASTPAPVVQQAGQFGQQQVFTKIKSIF